MYGVKRWSDILANVEKLSPLSNEMRCHDLSDNEDAGMEIDLRPKGLNCDWFFDDAVESLWTNHACVFSAKAIDMTRTF